MVNSKYLNFFEKKIDERRFELNNYRVNIEDEEKESFSKYRVN